jgi:hypothetical protein
MHARRRYHLAGPTLEGEGRVRAAADGKHASTLMQKVEKGAVMT